MILCHEKDLTKRCKKKNDTWMPPGHTRTKNWKHSKFQMILASFSPQIPKLCSDKSESGEKWILVSHWLIPRIWRILSQWEIRIHFPPLSDLSEHSFGINGANVARISLNFECFQFFYPCGARGQLSLIEPKILDKFMAFLALNFKLVLW